MLHEIDDEEMLSEANIFYYTHQRFVPCSIYKLIQPRRICSRYRISPRDDSINTFMAFKGEER